MLKDSGVDFRLTLAGAGPREKQLKYLTWKLGLADQVSFPGFVAHDEVSDLFREADIFLMPSVVHSSGDRDGIPTVIMEALLHRVPVIATDVSGIGELIEDGVTGMLIPEKQPLAIAQAVERMIRDRPAALEMAQTGRARVMEQFNPDINHKRVFDLYQAMFAGRQR
jgi:glycosyltransferase involved in cell wall biosynthesis